MLVIGNRRIRWITVAKKLLLDWRPRIDDTRIYSWRKRLRSSCIPMNRLLWIKRGTRTCWKLRIESICCLNKIRASFSLSNLVESYLVLRNECGHRRLLLHFHVNFAVDGKARTEVGAAVHESVKASAAEERIAVQALPVGKRAVVDTSVAMDEDGESQQIWLAKYLFLLEDRRN